MAQDYQNAEWAPDMPWLYYEKGALPDERKKIIDIQVAFDLEEQTSNQRQTI